MPPRAKARAARELVAPAGASRSASFSWAPAAGAEPGAAAAAPLQEDAAPTLVTEADKRSSKGPRRRLSRRHTDEKVDRALSEHFGGWTMSQTDLVMHGGISLRARLQKDIHEKHQGASGAARLGSAYWAELRTLYSTVDTTALADPFHVTDSESAVNPDLVAALSSANTPNTTTRTRAPLLAFFCSATSLTQREMCGLGRYMLTVRASVSASSLALGLDFLRMVHRLGLDKEHPVVWERGVRPWADDTLCAALSHMKKGGLGIEVFWRTHCAIAPFVVPIAAAEAILQCRSSWLEVAEELAQAVDSSKLGNKLFGFALSLVAASRIGKYAENLLLAAVAGNIDESMEKCFIADVLAEATRLNLHAALNERREIRLDYKGLIVTMPTQGISDEIGLRWSCFVRQHAVGVPPLPFEQHVFPGKDPRGKPSDSMLLPVKTSRETLLQLVKDHPDDCFVDICRKKADILLQGDRGARVDLAIGEAMVGEGGEALLHGKVLAALPDEGVDMTLPLSAQRLEQLRDSPVFASTSQKAQATVIATLEAVMSMMSGMAPVRRAFEHGRMPVIFQRFGYFLTHTTDAELGDEATSAKGAEAMRKHLAELRSTGAAQTLAALEKYHTFAWLLSGDDATLVAEKTKEALASVTCTRKGRGPSDDQKETPAAKKARVEKQSVMALFG